MDIISILTCLIALFAKGEVYYAVEGAREK
jgi:hypothetical protein